MTVGCALDWLFCYGASWRFWSAIMRWCVWLLLASMGPCLPAMAADAPLPPVFVKADVLNVRESPSGRVSGSLKRGNGVVITLVSGGWARISPEGMPARWVSLEHLCSGVSCWVGPYQSQSRLSPRSPYSLPRTYDSGTGCPCSGPSSCYGPRGGRYCITSGGNKRYR